MWLLKCLGGKSEKWEVRLSWVRGTCVVSFLCLNTLFFGTFSFSASTWKRFCFLFSRHKLSLNVSYVVSLILIAKDHSYICPLKIWGYRQQQVSLAQQKDWKQGDTAGLLSFCLKLTSCWLSIKEESIFLLFLYTSNSVSVFAPSHDTAAAIVLRCTTGEQPSCTFYTAEPVWSFLQRGTEMGEWEQKTQTWRQPQKEIHSRLQICDRQNVLTNQSGLQIIWAGFSLLR